jgi:hypothetical protein
MSERESEEQNEPSAVMERLSWQLAWRDDRRVAEALCAGEEIEEMHELSEAGLLDEFFVFVEQVGMMAVLERQKLPGVQRVLVPTIQFVLLYLLKVLFGGKSMNELPRWLLSNLALPARGDARSPGGAGEPESDRASPHGGRRNCSRAVRSLLDSGDSAEVCVGTLE